MAPHPQRNLPKCQHLENKHIRVYPARALGALGLLPADGALTVGWGKTFWGVGRVPLTKTDITRKRKVAH